MRPWDALSDLVVGAACPGCGEPGRRTCGACLSLLSRPRLARAVDEMLVLALTDYEGAAARMMRALKDGGSWSLASDCGAGLALASELVQELAGQRLGGMVPVPSRPAVVRARGFDHAAALARSAHRHGAPRVLPALSRSGRGVDQAGRGVMARIDNQRGSLRARPPRRSTAVVLVDDICTTGATLAAAATALRDVGWSVAGAVVVCSTAKRAPQMAN